VVSHGGAGRNVLPVAVRSRQCPVLAFLDVAADVEKVSNLDRMADLGIMATPALAVNGRIMCSGRVPSEAEIARWIKDAEVEA